jgi:hypothetical protein
MKSFLLILACCLFLAGCGVKLPPVAPEKDPEPANLNLNCSPTDPNCDKTDPNYRQPKSGK